MSPSAQAAFFDLDGTLLSVNSGRLWTRRERRLGRLSRWQVVEAVFYFAAYRFGFIEIESAMTRALATVKGLPEETVRGWTREWFKSEVVPFVAPGGRKAVAEHRAQGHRLILLTSTSPYESEIACEHLGLDAFLSTRYEVKDGVFSGRLLKPLCYGAGKVEVASRFAAEHDIDLAQSFFYSDSITDLPMLKRVGFPRVVNPDPRLYRAARREKWPILNWAE